MDATAIRRSISDSVLPYPDGAWDRVKYKFWKGVYPMHGVGRDMLLSLGILHHEGKQNYLIGIINPDRDVESFILYLESIGFLNHFISLKDDGEIISVRKAIDFEHQYHLRVFEGGEIRGHYEYTPESHPKRHMEKMGQEPRREDFLKFLGDWIIPASLKNEDIITQSVTRFIGGRPFASSKK